MDINKSSFITQQNTQSSINKTNNYAGPYTYIQAMANCIVNPITNIATRTIRYFRNELISADELYTLCKEEDIANVKQQLEDILSPYSYSRCRAWLYSPLSTQGETPIEFLESIILKDDGFQRRAYEYDRDDKASIAADLKKLKLDRLNRFKRDNIIDTISHIMEQKYQSSVVNAVPLGWLELQNPNNTPCVSACCTNCIIFKNINFIYSRSNNDADILALLYRYENSPHIEGSLTLRTAHINGVLFHIIKGSDSNPDLPTLNRTQNWLRVLKNYPYDLNHTTGKLQLRSSYIQLINRLKSKHRNLNLLNFVIELAMSIKKDSEDRYKNVKFNLELDICIVIEKLLQFLLEDKLVQTTKPDIESCLPKESFLFIKYMVANGEFPFCEQALNQN